MSSPKFFENEVIWKRDNEEENDMWDDTALIEAYDRAVNHVKEQIAKRNKAVSDSDGKASGTSSHKRKKRGRPKNKTWKVGDYCQAVYSEDGQPYEAIIKYINGGLCTVQFLGYKNEENVKIEDIGHSKGNEARIQQNMAAQKYNANYQHLDEINDNYAEDASSYIGTNSKQPHNYKNQGGKKHFTAHQYPSSFHVSEQSYSGPDQYHAFTSSANMPPQFPPPFPCHHKRNCMQTIPPMPPPPFPIEDGIVNEDEALASMLMSWYMSGYHTGYYQGLRQSQINPCTSKLTKNCSCNH